MTKKIIVDFGTHHGEGLHELIKTHGADETWEIYTFEANPYTYAHFREMRKAMSSIPDVKSKLPWLDWDIKYINKAVWDADVEAGMHCYRDSSTVSISLTDLYKVPGLEHVEVPISKHHVSGASTILDVKTHDEKYSSMIINTEAFDAGKWFNENIQEDDFVVLKMDIEGAEYSVLRRLIRSKTISMVDWIAIEWHPEMSANMKNPEWLKGFIEGYLGRLQDEGKLKITSWV